MIVGEQKKLAEIKELVAPYRKVLILGCGTCVKTCFAGGEDEVATLASALRLAVRTEGKEITIEEITVERQCEDEFIQEAAEAIARQRCGALPCLRCRCPGYRQVLPQGAGAAGSQYHLHWHSRKKWPFH